MKKAAAEWYLKAAKQGLAEAQSSLAFMYHYGRGVEKSSEESILLLEMAAVNGLGSAQRNLGIAYRDGAGTQINLKKSDFWLLEAVNSGDEEAKNYIYKNNFKFISY